MARTNYFARPISISNWLTEAGIIIGASVIISLCAPISIPLPFTPIPLAISLQVILFLSAFLGSRRAPLAVLAYIAQGVVGLPVFAGGAAGFLTLFGPRGGYLFGFVIAAFIMGWLCERMAQRTYQKLFASMAAANAIVYFFGALWLSTFLGMEKAILVGVLPFIPGDLLKILLALKILKKKTNT